MNNQPRKTLILKRKKKPLKIVKKSKNAGKRIYKFMCKWYLLKLGQNGLTDQSMISFIDKINESTDVCTGEKIPQPCAIQIGNSKFRQIYDIRGLYKLYLIKTAELEPMIDPYTSLELSQDLIDGILKKIRFMKALGFQYGKKTKAPDEVRIKEIIRLLGKYGYYVPSEYFHDLSSEDLKTIYYECSVTWDTYGLTNKEKQSIVKNGHIFNDSCKIFEIPNEMHKLLVDRVLGDMERMLTEGKTVDNRRAGAFYLMIGFAKAIPEIMDEIPILDEILGDEDF